MWSLDGSANTLMSPGSHSCRPSDGWKAWKTTDRRRMSTTTLWRVKETSTGASSSLSTTCLQRRSQLLTGRRWTCHVDSVSLWRHFSSPSSSSSGGGGDEEGEHLLTGQNWAEASRHPGPAGVGLWEALLWRLPGCVWTSAASSQTFLHFHNGFSQNKRYL